MSLHSEQSREDTEHRLGTLTDKINIAQRDDLRHATPLLNKLYAGNVAIRPVELHSAYHVAKANMGLPMLGLDTVILWLFSRPDYDAHRMQQFKIQRQLTTRGAYIHENIQIDLIDMGKQNEPRYMTLIYDGCNKSLFLVTSVDKESVIADLELKYFGSYNRKIEWDAVMAKWKHKGKGQRPGFVNVRTVDDNRPVDESKTRRPYPSGVFTGPAFKAIVKKYNIHHWFYDIKHPLHLSLYKLSDDLRYIVRTRPHGWSSMAHRAIAEYNGTVPTSPYISEISSDEAEAMMENNIAGDEKLVRAPED